MVYITMSTVAIVTGGSGAIGRAIASRLASTGRQVVITGRSMDKLQAAADQLQSAAAGGRIIPIACDVTDEQSVEGMFAAVANDHGPCSLLVNSAGIMKGGPTETLSAQVFSEVLSVNVVGPFICAREAFKQMMQHGGGRIINIGSIASESPRPDSAPYTTSKFAISGLTRSLALDGRQHNIAVGAIHPGNVLSDLLSADEIARREQTEGFITADDVAACVMTMVDLPASASVLELSVIPTKQPLVGRG